MFRFFLLLLFIVLLQVIGALLGLSFDPDNWYESLNKPFFTPHGSTFGAIWPVLYLLMAIAGWKVFISAGEKPGWGLWVTQLVMNWGWTPLFFGLHQLFWSMVLLAATLLVSITFTVTTWQRDRLASICFMPYCAWLTFALALASALWLMN